MTIAKPLVPGQRIGRYRVVRFLGAGAMGEVHLARDPTLARVVAIKLLKGGGSSSELDTQARLLREAQALAQLSHPHVVPVYDVGFHDERLFVALEYVRGRTLRQWLKVRRRPWPEVLGVLVQAGRGLAAAHEAGLVHRDFKPDNVLVDDQGRARVMDFGLARMAGGARVPTPSREEEGDLATDLTRTGWVLGTPRYMSPEQHDGAAVDARSDQFSFCVTLFEALYEVRAFGGKDVSSVSAAKRRGEIGNPTSGPRPDVARGLPPTVHQAILRGLSADPRDRFTSMADLLHELESSRRPRGQAIARIGGLAGLLIVSVAIASSDPDDPCMAGVERIDASWNPETRARLGRAFRSSDTPFAEDTFAATAVSIDGWSDRWRTARRDACAPSRSDDLGVDARLRCLDQSLRALDTTLEVLEAGRDHTLRHAVDLAHALPEIDACEDPSREDEAPSDPAQRDAMARSRQRLGEVGAYLTADLLGAAEATARLAIQEAEASAHAPAIASARAMLGEVLGRRGDATAAVRELGEAFWLAQQSGQDDTATRAATSLAYWEGVRQSRPEDGLGWARHARAALARAGDRPLLRAQLLQNEALVLAALGRFDEAIAEQDEAIALRRAQDPSHPLELALAHDGAADVLTDAGRLDDALQQQRNVLALRETVLGSSHPLLGETLVDVGVALRRVGEDAEAVRHLRRGIEILERADGPTDRRLAAPLRALGEALLAVEREAEAARVFARADEIEASTPALASPPPLR